MELFAGLQCVPDVDVFHSLAYVSHTLIGDVGVFKRSANVVGEIHAVSLVTAYCSPVSGVTLQGSHSCQTKAV